MIRILCQNCRCEDEYPSVDTFGVLICVGCHRRSWIKAEDGQDKSSAKEYSKCHGRCKIGKLAFEKRRKIDEMLIQGNPYKEIIQEFSADHLNGANLSIHKNKHLHPRYRVSRSGKEESGSTTCNSSVCPR
jgi:hypothetical protein